MALKNGLIIFTKEPIKGEVKTRLAKTIGNKKATKVYKYLLNNILNLNIKKNIDRFIALEPFSDEYESYFKNYNIFLQKGDNIGQKMSNSFQYLFELGYDNVVLVGCDIPLLDEKIINKSFEDLKSYQTIISKTKDGGYYLIGFQKNSFTNNCFEIDFTKDVYKQTVQRLNKLKIKEGKTLFDIDHLEDLKRFSQIKNLQQNIKLKNYSKKILSTLPKISVIIPVYYEKEAINKTILELKKNASCKNCFEIIVCDTPQKTTIEYIIDDDIKSVVSNKAGRAFQLNYGAKFARGDVFLFLHADTLVCKNWDRDILDLYKQNTQLAGAFLLGINTTIKRLKIVEFFANLRVKITNTPYGDQGQFFSSSLFEQVKAYDEIELMEDIQIVKKLHKLNIKMQIIQKKIYTSPRRWEKEGIFYTTFRNRILSTLYFFGVSSEKLKKYYKF